MTRDGDKTVDLQRPPVPERPPLLSVGQRIADRYVVERFVARGAMGEVYAVEDTLVAERVALKLLLPELARDSHALARFRREMQLARRVTHPNVCRVHDLSMHEDKAQLGPLEIRNASWFLTMEFLDGETLGDRVARVGALPLAEAEPIVRQVVAGLQALHAQDIVHRDVKPSNVMLAARGAVVTDFGLARAATGAQITSGVALLGSPHYMAPEQVTGATIGTAADIYALGVLLYEVVTGRRPFVGQTPIETAGLRLYQQPTPPRQHRPSLPAAWEAAILRCLQRAPADRFAHVEDLLTALGANT